MLVLSLLFQSRVILRGVQLHTRRITINQTALVTVLQEKPRLGRYGNISEEHREAAGRRRRFAGVEKESVLTVERARE